MKVNGWKTSLCKIKSNILFWLLLILVNPMLGCSSDDFASHKGDDIMKVKVVSLEKCSATDRTIALINEVAEETGLEINLEHAIVKTREDAVAQRHIGSPTVQINDLDIEPGARKIKQFGVT
jgi:hypothetical protein